jgi:cytochrome c553
MRAVAKELTPDEIQAVAAFYGARETARSAEGVASEN